MPNCELLVSPLFSFCVADGCGRLPQRARPGRRETSVVAMLSFIVTVAWKTLFGRPADNLEKSLESPLEYLLVDTGPNVR